MTSTLMSSLNPNKSDLRYSDMHRCLRKCFIPLSIMQIMQYSRGGQWTWNWRVAGFIPWLLLSLLKCPWARHPYYTVVHAPGTVALECIHSSQFYFRSGSNHNRPTSLVQAFNKKYDEVCTFRQMCAHRSILLKNKIQRIPKVPLSQKSVV